MKNAYQQEPTYPIIQFHSHNLEKSKPKKSINKLKRRPERSANLNFQFKFNTDGEMVPVISQPNIFYKSKYEESLQKITIPVQSQNENIKIRSNNNELYKMKLCFIINQS